ncbi:KDO2-lipid IV(A) lauroyltransferase [Mariniphaga anaerophila]|uniref:KDO2-lipid IV(A) lauroyltransferase n=1 Tax=Mariniphaga anaerophila TaxID=1484053 RepID=A0A1M5FWM8_9BACT|nr:lysophospholipid acyltransferase family protein [Mariniphaga anaerophila]SHF95908.1 KDO2-lipid IV(A) lauroyltransferase [Mariniphaga anaerophila]
MSKGNSTHIGIFSLKMVALFPFWIIYILSDILYVVVFHIMGYRKDVVYMNLRNSFPEKSESELRKIRKRFYRHLCDLIMEAIKLGSIKKKNIKKRMAVKNPELINNYFEQGKSVVVLTMHQNNWEWGGAFPLFIKHNVLGVYKPLHNLQFNKYINDNRARFGAEMTSDSSILRRIIRAEKSHEPVFIWLAGDQTPPAFYKFWTMFLNQETVFYPGPAAISRRFNYPVIFQNTVKVKRGFYETTFEVLFENPQEHSEFEIMNAYIRKMEKIINDKPEYYLWSHKRWKNKRPAEVPLQV